MNIIKDRATLMRKGAQKRAMKSAPNVNSSPKVTLSLSLSLSLSRARDSHEKLGMSELQE